MDEKERLINQLKELAKKKDANRLVQILSQHELMLSQLQSNIDHLTARKVALSKKYEEELKRILADTDAEIDHFKKRREMLKEVYDYGKRLLGINKNNKKKGGSLNGVRNGSGGSSPSGK